MPHPREIQAKYQKSLAKLKATRDRLAAEETTRPRRPLPPSRVEAAVRRDTIHLDRLDPASVQFLWQPWLPAGKLCLLDGDPGLGKSFVTLDLAARLSRGGPWPDGTAGPGRPVPSLLVSCEDGLRDTILPRLLALGADRKHVHAYQGRLDRSGRAVRVPVLPDDLDVLRAIIEKHAIKLVVIDPLMAFLAASVNTISDQSVRSVLAPLARMAEQTGATVLFVRHLNKSGGKQAVYRGGGSIGIIAAMRAGLLIGRNPHDRDQRVLAMVKCNLAAEPKSLAFRLAETPAGTAVAWDGTVDLHANDLVGDVKEAVDPKGWLRQALAGGPRPVADLIAAAAEVGISQRTLERAKAAVAVVSLQQSRGRDKTWFWALPGQSLPLGPMLDPLF